MDKYIIKMLNLAFSDIPENWKILNNQDELTHKVYSNFIFKYLQLEDISEKADGYITDRLEQFLFNYLKDFKFITLQFTNFLAITQNQLSNSSLKKIIPDKDNNIDVIICVEKECIFIGNISISLINKVINKLKESKISILNLTNASKNEEISNEINNFCKIINCENIFVKFTITPVACYLIRRYFYPTYFFKDPSFFIFGDNKNSFEQKNKESIDSLLFPDSIDEKSSFNKFIEVNKDIKNQKF